METLRNRAILQEADSSDSINVYIIYYLTEDHGNGSLIIAEGKYFFVSFLLNYPMKILKRYNELYVCRYTTKY